MRALTFILGIAAAAATASTAAGCGGPAKPPPGAAAGAAGAPAAPATASTGGEGDAFATEYCRAYRGCAEEQARFELAADLPAGQSEPDPAALAAAVRERVDYCLSSTSGLSLEQQQWLESCTGCGGSCDVYRCIGDVPARITEPFSCSLGE